MANVSITLPGEFAVTSRGTFVNVDLGTLSAEIIARLALHGLNQKVADSAAGAMTDAGFGGLKFDELDDAQRVTVQAKARESMAAVVASLTAGEWTERRAGAASVDPVTARVRVLFAAWLRKNAADVWTANFKGLDAAERGPALDAFLAAQDAATIAKFTKSAKTALASEAEAAADLGKLTLTTKLVK